MADPAPLRVASRCLLAALGVSLSSLLGGCGSAKPPASQFPSGDQAIARLHETQSCGEAVAATAKVDHFGQGGRVRGTLLMFAKRAANLRLDAVSPFGVTLATLTANDDRFALADLRDKRFYVGPAEPCNIARLTGVPLPGHALVSLLRGDAPVLTHQSTQIAWRDGRYVVTVPSRHDASQELWLGVHPSDREKPWQQQRLRLLGVTVRQFDGVLYRATLDGHSPAQMAEARPDPDGLPPELGGTELAPSGPMCQAELPKNVHVVVPPSRSDVLFRYDEVSWNPPIPAGAFTQQNPGGLTQVEVDCPR